MGVSTSGRDCHCSGLEKVGAAVGKQGLRHTSRAAISTQTSWIFYPWLFIPYYPDPALLLHHFPSCSWHSSTRVPDRMPFSALWCLFMTIQNCIPPSIQQHLGKGCSECHKARVSSRLEGNVLAGSNILTCIREISNLIELSSPVQTVWHQIRRPLEDVMPLTQNAWWCRDR